MSQLICTEHRRLTATPQALSEMHEALEQFWLACDAAAYPPPAGRWRLIFATAVGEIGANIVRHAYADGSVGMIDFRLRLLHGKVVARFVDSGIMYVPNPVPPPEDDPLLWFDLPEAGRGLQIATSTMDRLQYRRTAGGFNIWRLVKYTPL